MRDLVAHRVILHFLCRRCCNVRVKTRIGAKQLVKALCALTHVSTSHGGFMRDLVVHRMSQYFCAAAAAAAA